MTSKEANAILKNLRGSEWMFNQLNPDSIKSTLQKISELHGGNPDITEAIFTIDENLRLMRVAFETLDNDPEADGQDAARTESMNAALTAGAVFGALLKRLTVPEKRRGGKYAEEWKFLLQVDGEQPRRGYKGQISRMDFIYGEAKQRMKKATGRARAWKLPFATAQRHLAKQRKNHRSANR